MKNNAINIFIASLIIITSAIDYAKAAQIEQSIGNLEFQFKDLQLTVKQVSFTVAQLITSQQERDNEQDARLTELEKKDRAQEAKIEELKKQVEAPDKKGNAPSHRQNSH